jgi:hypothetical protein
MISVCGFQIADLRSGNAERANHKSETLAPAVTQVCHKLDDADALGFLTVDCLELRVVNFFR